MYGSLAFDGLLESNGSLARCGMLKRCDSLAQSVFMRISVRCVGSGFYEGCGSLLRFGVLNFLGSLLAPWAALGHRLAWAFRIALARWLAHLLRSTSAIRLARLTRNASAEVTRSPRWVFSTRLARSVRTGFSCPCWLASSARVTCYSWLTLLHWATTTDRLTRALLGFFVHTIRSCCGG